MDMWLIIFIGSGSAIILFIILKLIQEKFRVLLFWPETRTKSEKMLRRWGNRVISRQIDVSIWTTVSERGKQKIHGVRAWFTKKSDPLVSVVKGKQKLDNRGNASYFLHDITSTRDRFRGH
jgi:hypothetical protein